MNTTLYQCAADVQAVLNAEFDSEQIKADTLEAAIGDFETKAVSVCAYHLNQLAEIEMLDRHIKAMSERKKVLENAAQRLKEYLQLNMQKTGISEIKAIDGTFSAKLVKTPPSVEVYDSTLLEPEFIRTKTTTEPNKAAIKAAIEEGKEVQGARLTQSQTIRIK